MENNLYYVKMSNEIYGPYSAEEMGNFNIPDDTPITTNPDGEWCTFMQLGFSHNTQEESWQVSEADRERWDAIDKKRNAQKDILFGLLWCIGGIIVTMITYNNASDGGTYIIAWGAILFGGIQFLKGLFHYF